MKSSLLFFLGLITILFSAVYLINPSEFQISNFNQVFAQPEDKNKNFDDALTIHSSETVTHETKNNSNREKIFDDAITIHSSDTASIEKSTDNIDKNKNLDFWLWYLHDAIPETLKKLGMQILG